MSETPEIWDDLRFQSRLTNSVSNEFNDSVVEYRHQILEEWGLDRSRVERSEMLSLMIQSGFILLNLISLVLGVISIVFLLLVPEEYDSGDSEIRNLLIYSILFVIVSKLGIIGSYFMCKLCLIVYSIAMVTMIIFNFLSWFVVPSHALIATPVHLVLMTSLFDLIELVCALYLICMARTEQSVIRITPLKSVQSLH